MKPGTVYRFRAADGTDLYTGASTNPLLRFRDHSRASWWTDVAVIELEHFPSRYDALVAEADAIRERDPKYNAMLPTLAVVQGRVPPRSNEPTPEMVERGRVLRIARIRTLLSQEELAHELGVTAKTVGRWERGQSSPRLRHIDKLNRVLSAGWR